MLDRCWCGVTAIYSWRHSTMRRARTYKLIDDSSQHWCMCTTACMSFNPSRCTYVCVQALMRIVCWCCQETHIYYILLHYSATHQCGVELWSAGRQHSRSSCQPLTLGRPGTKASSKLDTCCSNCLTPWMCWLWRPAFYVARWRQKRDYTTLLFLLVCQISRKYAWLCVAII